MEPFKVKKKLTTVTNLISDEMEKDKPNKDLLNKMKKLRNKLYKELHEATGGLSISDHAMLRYIQRAMGIDVESIRWGLLGIIKKLYKGNGNYPLGSGLHAIIKNKVVVSILEGKVDYLNNGKGILNRKRSPKKEDPKKD
jgi:hypothetical protein